MNWVKHNLFGQLTIEPLAIIRHFIDPKDICLDIGAHAGAWTVPLSKLCAHVYAFEALPYYNNILQMTIRLLHRKNITLLNKAVMHQNGFINLVWQDQNGQKLPGKTSHCRQEVTHFSTTVEGVMLDDFLLESALNIARVRFIKIDIEGAELLALQGATQLITQSHPLIYLEICNDYCKNYGYSAKDIFKFLTNYDYQAVILQENLTIQPTDMHRYAGQGNVLFVPPHQQNQLNALFPDTSKSYFHD